jgi:prepilin-type N-terminal cleavage/methylation domain-containing protein
MVHPDRIRPGKSSRQRGAFTLIELTIVVLILGIIASIAVYRGGDFSQSARIKATAVHLQQIAQAADRYFAEHGQWPDDKGPGVLPTALVGMMRRSDFRKTPIGGLYDWNGSGGVMPFIGISIAPFPGYTISAADQQALDAFMDDGDLSKGSLQQVGTVYGVALQYIQDQN